MYRYLLLLQALLWAPSAFSQEKLSLAQAIDLALEQNYTIRIVRNDQRLAENNLKLANAAFYPVVTAGGQYNRSYNAYFELQRNVNDSTGTRVQKQRFDGLTNATGNLNLTVNWTIFNGLGMFSTYQRLEELQAASIANTKVNIENTLAAVMTAYYNVIQQKNRIRVATNALNISQENLRLARNRYDVGAGSRQDFLLAQVNYNTDKSLLISQQQLLQEAKINLNRLLNRSASTDFDPSDSLQVNPSLKLEDLQQAVISQNPNLLVAQRNKNASYLAIKELQALRYPTVNAFAGASRNYNANRAFAVPNISNSVVINYGVSAAVTIFNGNALNRQIQSARIAEETAHFQYDNLKVQLLADLEAAFLQYKNSLLLLELERQNLQVANQNVTISLERFKTGVTTQIETRQVQQNAVSTDSRLIDALFNAKVAEVELIRLSSRILQEEPKK
jgi:outer membrane protein